MLRFPPDGGLNPASGLFPLSPGSPVSGIPAAGAILSLSGGAIHIDSNTGGVPGLVVGSEFDGVLVQ